MTSERNVAARLRAAIADYELECICLDRRSAPAKRASVALSGGGFETIATRGPFEVWKARAGRTTSHGKR